MNDTLQTYGTSFGVKNPQFVMAGLVGVPARRRAGCPVPAISLRKARLCLHYRDRRDKRGDDDGEGIQLVPTHVRTQCRVGHSASVTRLNAAEA
jgi:hypothetical protein